MITVDCREPKAYRDLFPGAKIEQMVVGDFTNGTLLIERKDAKDFVSSILDGRLWKQCENLNQSRSVIVIEGDLEAAIKFHMKRSRRPYIHLHNIVYGSYASLIARENYDKIKIAHVKDKTHFKYMVLKMFEKCDYKQRIVNRIKSPNPSYNILVGFPGVSVMRAKKLLDKYGSVQDAIANVEDWKNVVGPAVGKRCSEAIRHTAV